MGTDSTTFKQLKYLDTKQENKKLIHGKSENSTQLMVFTPDKKLHVRVHFLPGHLYLQEGLEDQAVQEVQYYPGDPVKVSQECKLSQSHLEWTTKGHTLKQLGRTLFPEHT